jgi:FeS assembly protein IscX
MVYHWCKRLRGDAAVCIFAGRHAPAGCVALHFPEIQHRRNAMDDKLHWLDVELIAEELAEEYPDRDPVGISFPELRRLVEDLDEFEAREGHPCNERILEAIQANWIKEMSDIAGYDEDEDD